MGTKPVPELSARDEAVKNSTNGETACDHCSNRPIIRTLERNCNKPIRRFLKTVSERHTLQLNTGRQRSDSSVYVAHWPKTAVRCE
jgi:hypothetical protein